MPVVYIDVLLILNLWVDFLLLSATARLLRLPVRRWRLFCAALLGAAESCLLFLPPLSFLLSLLIRCTGTLLLTLVGFPLRGWRVFGKTVLTLLTLSAAFSGIVTMLWYFLAPAGFLVVNGVIYYDAPAALLILLTAISYVAVCVWEHCLRKRAPRGRLFRLLLQSGGKTVVCRCLYDTGSTLREPFSGSPAVLIDRAAAKSILPPSLREGDARHVRYVPYKSLGGAGLLPAFLPEKMEIADENGNFCDISGSYLAVCEELGHGEYTALVGTDIGELLTKGSGK